MWLLISRAPPPDAPNWRGRRALAAFDAVAWPLAWIAASLHLPSRGGLAGAVLIGVATIVASRRLRRALFDNRRYFFTTWRLAKVLALLLVIGLAVKWT